jgi:glycosyltransferase involved in cell wall biosynthesis
MNFVKALMHAGHEVHTIAPKDDYTFKLEEAGCHHHNVYMDSPGANVLKDAALLVELTSLYSRIKPDVVLHFTIKPNIYGTLAAAMVGIPSINNVCGLGTVFLKNGIVSWIAQLLYKVAFRFPKKVFFQNPDDLELFIKRKLISPNKAALLPGSGIDLAMFQPTPFKRNSTFTFLLVSRLIIDKGIYEFIDAIRLLKAEGVRARFQVLGAKDPLHKRGIPIKTIEGWRAEGLIEYFDKTDDVRPYIQQADCVVLPSYREGSPKSLMEAASLAKPVVTTDVPGCRQVVKDGFNGLLCKPYSAKDLADKMMVMTKIPSATLQLMGECGRRKMELEFSDTVVINKYLSAIEEVTSPSSTRMAYLPV